MDGINAPSWRTDLYATCGEIMSHKESIELIAGLGGKFTPEFKEVKHLPAGYSYHDIRQKIIDEYQEAGNHPRDVWAQSFFLADVEYWIANEPAFSSQAVFLDDRVYATPTGYDDVKDLTSMQALAAKGVRIIAPPTFALLEVDGGRIVPSEYAINAKAAGLDIITWTLERSGRLSDLTPGSFYYSTITRVVDNEGDMMTVIDVLAKEVGVLGIFSDWPAAITYDANCMGLK
jgi:glycerophosphoryl diester phosphodiesterase